MVSVQVGVASEQLAPASQESLTGQAPSVPHAHLALLNYRPTFRAAFGRAHLGRDSASVVDLADRTWRQMREAIDGHAAAMHPFIGECYGQDAVQQAWLEFTFGASEEFVQGDPNTELFLSWLFHRWQPDSRKSNRIVDPSLYGISPTRAYLDRRVSRLNPLLCRYLEACLATSFGFHEILNCQPGIGFTRKRQRPRPRLVAAIS